MMKAVIQRVSCAKVTVDGHLISEIGQGLCVLVGIYQSNPILIQDSRFSAKLIWNFSKEFCEEFCLI